MDHSRAELPSLTAGGADLHLHSTASDGALAPEEVVRRAAQAGLEIIALSDHDSVAGVAPAAAEGARLGVEVIPACELSVRGPAGELHLLAYGVPIDDPELAAFLAGARSARQERAATMVAQLRRCGVAIELAAVEAAAGGAPIGRPHVARVLQQRGVVRSFAEAFDRFLGRGRPAFVPKALPELAAATALVRSVGGVTSAAHLGPRATPALVQSLRADGVDGLEVLHPSHAPDVQRRLDRLAAEHELLRTGGSDWHGAAELSPSHGTLGAVRVPRSWVDALRRRAARADVA